MKRHSFLLLLLLTLFSCRKSFKEPKVQSAVAVPIQFDAAAYDQNAVLSIEIYDTNTQGIYYKGTTTSNIYSGQTNILPGTSITFKVIASTITDINTQITSNNKVVASGAYSAAQQQGSAAVSVLYYKVQ